MFNDKDDQNLHDSLICFKEEIKRYPILTREQEVELFKKIEEGDVEARKIVASSNLKLVVKFSVFFWTRRTSKKKKSRFFSLDDLIQEGMIGLHRAIDKFDWRRGYKFSTYASWWIRNSITRSIETNHSATVRMPVSMSVKMSKYKKAITRLYIKLGRKPTLEELSVEMNLPVSKIELLKKNLEVKQVSVEAKLSSKFSKDPLIDSLSGKEKQPWENASFAESERKRYEVISKALDCLKPVEREIISIYFGINTDTPRNLPQIAGELGVSVERVRQIKERALTKMLLCCREELAEIFFSLKRNQL